VSRYLYAPTQSLKVNKSANAESWGKISPESIVTTCYSDATIAFPILATALAQNAEELAQKSSKPSFKLGEKHQFSFE